MRPHAREIAGKCSTRPRAGRALARRSRPSAARARSASVQSAPESAFARSDVGPRQAAHQALHELGREAAPEQEARLRRALRRARGQGGETARANGGGALDLGRGERRRELGRQLDRVLRELAADALNAEALRARMNARLGEARVGEKAIRLEPVEQRVDLGRDCAPGSASASAAGSASRLARVAQELPAQLEPALVALREQLQGARLERSLRLHLGSLSP